MVASNSLPSVAACPSPLAGWTDLTQTPAIQVFREILFADPKRGGPLPLSGNAEDDPQALAQKSASLSQYVNQTVETLQAGLPQGSLCQQNVAGNTAYFVKTTDLKFVELILKSVNRGPFETLQEMDMGFSKAIDLITARRHAVESDAVQIAAFVKAMPPVIAPDDDASDWNVVSTGLTSSLVALIRFEMGDQDNVLFRKARYGEAYYVTTDVEKLPRMIAMLREVKRDLEVVGQLGAATGVSGVIEQLNQIYGYKEASKSSLQRPPAEILVAALGGIAVGLAAGFFFHAGGDLWVVTKRALVKWLDATKNDGNPPSAGVAGGASHVVATAHESPASADTDEFNAIDNRVDAGEAADFQNDPLRAYDPVQHFHVNGVAVASVAVVGGVALLVPVVIPYLVAASPEVVSLATGVGALAVSR